VEGEEERTIVTLADMELEDDEERAKMLCEESIVIFMGVQGIEKRAKEGGKQHTVSAVRRSLNVTICAPEPSELGSMLSNSPRCYVFKRR